jgi:hypothetical protein
MNRYALFVLVAVLAVAILAGCASHRGFPPRGNAASRSITVEITLREEAESTEGGGALETKDLMKLVQRVNIGEDFESRNEERKEYTRKESGVDVTVTGRKMFSIDGSTKALKGSDKFVLSVELQYLDEEANKEFSASPSTMLPFKESDEIILTESGQYTVTLKLSEPDDTEYTK